MCEICDGTWPFPETAPTVDEAIRTIEHSRHVHVQWAEYMEANPDFDPGKLGNAKFHRACIVRYDRVLQVLRSRV